LNFLSCIIFHRTATTELYTLSLHDALPISVADGTDGRDGGADLVDVAEGLEDEQVDAGFGQRGRLLAEDALRLVDARAAPRLDADAERPDGAGDERPVARGLAGDAHAGGVDRLELAGEPERFELHAVGAEGVALEDVSARPDVLPVHLFDEVGLAQVECVEGAV